LRAERQKDRYEAQAAGRCPGAASLPGPGKDDSG